MIEKNQQIYKFALYGFLKNLRFYDPFILLFFREVGISFLQIGLLFSVREISTNLVEIPSGILADRFGRKLAMILSFSFYILSFILFYFFNIIGIYFFGMIIYGFADAFRSGTHKAMIFDYLEANNWADKKIQYYGYTRSWSLFGSALSSLIAAFIVFYSKSYRPIFLYSIIPYLLNFWLIISYPNYLNFPKERHESSYKLLLNFFELFKLSQFRRAILNSTIFDGLFKSTKDYLQPILVSMVTVVVIFPSFTGKQNSSVLIGIVYFIIFVISAFSARNANWFKELFHNNKSAINYSFILGLILIFLSGLLYVLKLQILSVVFLILIYSLQNFRRPINVDMITESIPPKIMASGLSLESQLKTFVIAILSPIMGWLVDKFDIGFGLIWIAVILLFISPFAWVRKKNM
jgi:MFS family permease